MDCALLPKPPQNGLSSLLAGTLQGATYIVKFSLPARQTPFQVVDLLLQLNLPLFGMLSLRRLEQCV